MSKNNNSIEYYLVILFSRTKNQYTMQRYNVIRRKAQQQANQTPVDENEKFVEKVYDNHVVNSEDLPGPDEFIF